MLPTTKTMIAAAFLELARVKSIDKITVKDIVESCSITRQTFYYHFQDIMNVIEWSLEQKMEEILARSLEAPTMQGALRVLVSTVEENPEIINKLMNSQRREETERLLVATIRSYLEAMIDRKELFTRMNRLDLEIALRFYTYAILGLLLEISRSHKAVDLDLITRQIVGLIRGDLFREDNPTG